MFSIALDRKTPALFTRTLTDPNRSWSLSTTRVTSFARDIGLHRMSHSTPLHKLLDSSSEPIGIDMCLDDAGALAQEPSSYRQPHALGGARDDCHLADDRVRRLRAEDRSRVQDPDACTLQAVAWRRQWSVERVSH